MRHAARTPKLGLLLAALATGGLALGSAHAAPPGGISGYTVSNVRWDVDGQGSVTSLAFRLSPARARTVRVQLGSSGRWVGCAVRGGGRASCALPQGVGVAALDQLAVTAF
jgi:hypothetical protein